MCNKSVECLNKANNPVDKDEQSLDLMDTPTSVTNSTPGSNRGWNDETPRVKFLCSFLGSIIPRPQDGKLRYVGGETRIIYLPRDISFGELMNKMRELYDGVAVLKYRQPDEDLDALVSVVNDDDVSNMMEEYEKLGSGDGFTRLRLFLFSQLDQDFPSHYVDGDEREIERRYVDALNNLNDGADFRRQQPESPMISTLDDIHVQELIFIPMSLDGGLLSQRSAEIPMAPYNLRHANIPQRYSEVDAPWSPAYYSPRHHGHHDPRPISDLLSSPTSARYGMQFGNLADKGLERVPEEYSRSQLDHHAHDHQPQHSENVLWTPAGSVSGGDKAGFPGNLLHVPSVYDGNSVCEHCCGAFQRNQVPLEQPNMANGLPYVANLCADCPPSRESFMLNADPKFYRTMFAKDQNDPHSVYNESHSYERGWVLQHQMSPHADEARMHFAGAGRFNDHYIVDSSGMNNSLGHANLVDGHYMSSSHIHHRLVPELGNEVFHDQAPAAVHHLHIPSPEECTARYGKFPYAYGTENLYPLTHGHVQGHALWRHVHSPMHGAHSFEPSSAIPQVNGTVSPTFFWGAVEGSQRNVAGVDDHGGEYAYGHALKASPNTYVPESVHSFAPIQIPISPEMWNSSATLAASVANSDVNNTNVTEVTKLDEKRHGVEKEANYVENLNVPEPNMIATKSGAELLESTNSSCLKHPKGAADAVKVDGEEASAVLADSKLSPDRLSFLPELIASVKKAALEEAKEVKARVEENEPEKLNSVSEEATIKESEAVNANEELELDSDNDYINNKIEPTKAEEEAIEKGLQTIKNDDLEEIRELGSGTYGAVYHGKWKGSDVAIKRIKASCFAGRPSERERLIEDFWKEALILNSLHHPNVVSFYGIVRDGPDGSLATVTEFMVNGSLKQFLQKKDRTIDHRKRLIIAMDAACGMEYLHGKNIVHFDLKGENLLVNMRDPQRPICKIGDLGLSKVKQHTLVSGSVRGSLPWMAPELLSGKSHMVTEKIDVYSFGIVMWELLTGEEPYSNVHCASIIGGIVNNTSRPQIPTWCDPEWKSLMESCWGSEPSERPSFSEISHKLRNMAAAFNVK